MGTRGWLQPCVLARILYKPYGASSQHALYLGHAHAGEYAAPHFAYKTLNTKDTLHIKH